MPAHFEKIKTGGVKVSDELVRIHIADPSPHEQGGRRLCSILAAEKISMSFLTIDRTGGEVRTSCCIDREHEDRVRGLVQSDKALKDHARFTPAVGLLTIFPHQSQLQMLGICLYALGKADLMIMDLSSSLAALSFVLRSMDLKAALTALSQFFLFPSDPDHLRSTVRVRQA